MADPLHAPGQDGSGSRHPYLLVAASCLLLLGSIGVLVWKVWDLRQELSSRAPGVSYRDVQELITVEITDSEGRSHRIFDQDWDHLLVFLFTPHDCPLCHDELLDLEALAAIPGLAIYGVMAYASPDEAGQVRESYGLSFPVIPDPDGVRLSALAPPKTPWKVLVRRRDNRILFEDPESSIPAERRAFSHRLRILVGQ